MAATRDGFAFGAPRALSTYLEQRAKQLDLLMRQKQREIEAAKRAVIAMYSPPPAPRRQPSPPPRRAPPTRGTVRENIRAAGSGFADGVSFGVADWASAAVKTAAQGGTSDFRRRWSEALAAEQAQDQFDKENYGGARFAGQGVGTVASLALGGGVLGVGARGAAAAGRLASNGLHVVRLGAPAGIAGGAIGGAAHIGIDAANGVRSNPSDVVASVLGGAIGGVAAPLVGPVRAGSLVGAATPVLQGAFRGEAPSVPEVLAGAGVGVIAGGGSKLLTDSLFEPLDMVRKGKLGERLSHVARYGPLTAPAKKKRVYLKGGGYTVPDILTKREVVEVKTGLLAELSKRQRQAKRVLDNYVVEHWLPRDLASLKAIGVMGLGAPNIEVPDHLQLSPDRPSR
jgi:hypothetical protein